MSRDYILKQFKDEDKNLVINLYEKMRLSQDKDIPVFGSNFYPPNVWKVFEGFNSNLLKVESFGGFLDSERRMISFNNLYDIPYPMKILKITNPSKFKKLTHKDYLGSIMSLGILRDKIGDLITKENVCYVSLSEEISDYIIMNLEKISSVPCIIEEFLGDTSDISIDFKEEVILVNSLRLDSVVSKITKKSRSFAQELISDGKALKNYNIIRDKSDEISISDRITIRGYGKFIVHSVPSTSKSGKLKVIIKKYT